MKTEAARRKRHSTTALTAKVTAIAVAAAIAITGGLAIQMAQGRDPALAPKAKAQAQADKAALNSTAPARVVTRTS